MKKLLQIGVALCCIFATQYSFAAGYQNNQVNYQTNGQAVQGQNSAGCCPADHPCPCEDKDCCEGYELYCHYEPCYYQTPRCVEVSVPCKKRCCRKVCKPYCVQRCKMVPQYYTETCNRYEDEWYEVDDCKTCTQTVYDQHCDYKKSYYWKRTGNGPCGPCPALPASCCQ